MERLDVPHDPLMSLWDGERKRGGPSYKGSSPKLITAVREVKSGSVPTESLSPGEATEIQTHGELTSDMNPLIETKLFYINTSHYVATLPPT